MARRYIVRYGALRKVAEFSVKPPNDDYARGDQVIVRSPRGMEWGEVCRGVLSPWGARPPT